MSPRGHFRRDCRSPPVPEAAEGASPIPAARQKQDATPATRFPSSSPDAGPSSAVPESAWCICRVALTVSWTSTLRVIAMRDEQSSGLRPRRRSEASQARRPPAQAVTLTEGERKSGRAPACTIRRRSRRAISPASPILGACSSRPRQPWPFGASAESRLAQCERPGGRSCGRGRAVGGYLGGRCSMSTTSGSHRVTSARTSTRGMCARLYGGLPC
jgi:hypothetical protein